MAAIAAAVTLADVFGAKNGKLVQIGDIVAAFDFSKMSSRDLTAEDYLHQGLAPSMGKLTSKALQDMDTEMKVMIAGLTKQISQLPVSQRTWEAIVSLCSQSPFLEPYGENEVVNIDKFLKNSSNDWKFDGSPQAPIVKEVESWFTKLISDDDVIQSTKIDIDTLARIVAQTGATVTGIETFFARHEFHQKTMVDIGILRYPDYEHPYFKVYRIRLTAWSDSSRILWHSEDKNGITGEYHARKYKPRSKTIEGMTSKAIQSAIDTANNLFS